MKIGQNIKARREASGLSQLELSLRTPDSLVTPSDLSRIENDKQWPTREKLDAIAEVLGCAVYELFMENSSKPPIRAEEEAAEYQVDPAADQQSAKQDNVDRLVAALDRIAKAIERLKE